MFQRALFIFVVVFGVGCMTGRVPQDNLHVAKEAYGNFENDLINVVLTQQEPAFTKLVTAIHVNYHSVDEANLDEVRNLLKVILTSDQTMEAVAVMEVVNYGFTENFAKKMLLRVRDRYVSDIENMEFDEALEWLGYVKAAESVYSDISGHTIAAPLVAAEGDEN